MKSRIATLMAAVLATAQPAAGQIGQEIEPRPARAADTPAVPGPDRAGRPVPMQAGESEQHVHVVRRGDTLWDLAGHYYENPFAWPTIHRANPEVVEDPHWIYPQERLVIPGRMTAVAEGPPFAPGRITEIPAAAADATRRTRFYARDEGTADPVILTAEALRRGGVQPGEHYSAPWLGQPGMLPIIGTVVRSVDAPNTGFEDDLMVHPFDDIYVEYRGEARPQPGQKLLVVNTGDRMHGLDRLIRPTGIATVVDTDSDVLTARVTEQWGTMRRGDVALPLGDFAPVVGEAEPISGGPVGRIIGWLIDQPLYGTSDHGFVDLGSNSGVQVGDVMLAYREARQRGATDLPAEPVAYVKIVRVNEDNATFRVTKVLQRRLQEGLAVQVVSRIP